MPHGHHQAHTSYLDNETPPPRRSAWLNQRVAAATPVRSTRASTEVKSGRGSEESVSPPLANVLSDIFPRIADCENESRQTGWVCATGAAARRRRNRLLPFAPIARFVWSCRTIPFSSTSTMNQSFSAAPFVNSAAVRTSRSIGKVGLTPRRIRVAVLEAGISCGITTSKSTSESTVGVP